MTTIDTVSCVFAPLPADIRTALRGNRRARRRLSAQIHEAIELAATRVAANTTAEIDLAAVVADIRDALGLSPYRLEGENLVDFELVAHLLRRGGARRLNGFIVLHAEQAINGKPGQGLFKWLATVLGRATRAVEKATRP